MKTILVTGSNGQLGSELQQLAALYPQFNFIFTTRATLAIDDPAAVSLFFKQQPVHACINCAAYTAVDKAETEPEKAFLINATAVGNLAKICREHQCAFIHISTDYVFDGSSNAPYTETSPTNPLGRYGASKLAGEKLAFENNAETLIIRTSWVYSAYGHNFVKTILRLMHQRDCVNVVNDQFGSPTYAADLAKVILDILQQWSTGTNKWHGGIYHYANEGVISWYEFAVAIRDMSNRKCVVNPISSSAYPTPAKRPAYSVFDTTKIKSTFGLQIPAWQHSLQACLLQLNRYLA